MERAFHSCLRPFSGVPPSPYVEPKIFKIKNLSAINSPKILTPDDLDIKILKINELESLNERTPAMGRSFS
jgi:hypothetical protein